MYPLLVSSHFPHPVSTCPSPPPNTATFGCNVGQQGLFTLQLGIATTWALSLLFGVSVELRVEGLRGGPQHWWIWASLWRQYFCIPPATPPSESKNEFVSFWVSGCWVEMRADQTSGRTEEALSLMVWGHRQLCKCWAQRRGPPARWAQYRQGDFNCRIFCHQHVPYINYASQEASVLFHHPPTPPFFSFGKGQAPVLFCGSAWFPADTAQYVGPKGIVQMWRFSIPDLRHPFYSGYFRWFVHSEAELRLFLPKADILGDAAEFWMIQEVQHTCSAQKLWLWKLNLFSFIVQLWFQYE